MRYILDDSGYIDSVSCTPFNCKDKSCQEYTGTIPSGYDTLQEWAQNANIRAYKIVEGNLSYDAAKAAELEAEWGNATHGNIGNIGKMIWLYKSSSQILSANTKTQVAYNGTYYNNSNGSLIKNGSSIVIGDNVNAVNVSCRFRDNDDSKRKYIYIQKNGVDVAIHDAITTNININDCISVTKGDVISIYGYCPVATTLSGGNGLHAWDYFKVTVIA